MTPRPAIDLNAIVRTVHNCQRQGDSEIFSPVDTIHVDHNGNLIHSKDLGANHPETLSTVQPDTFHFDWKVDERRYAETEMPPNSRIIVTREGVHGWLYSFQTEFLDTYTMFAFFDGSLYQVLLVDPCLEQRFRSSHICHMNPDGRIDFGGMNPSPRTLADAYAKSVLWANGVSAITHGYIEYYRFHRND